MNCFNHENNAAAALCKNCNKSLCKECAVDTGYGMACKGKCEFELKAINELITENRKRAKHFNKYWTPFKILIYVLVIVIGFILLRFFEDGNDTHTTEAPAAESLEDRMEKGLYSTFTVDTLLSGARKIYFNYDFNEVTCSWLIKQLVFMDGKTGNKPIDLYLCSNGGYIAEAKAVSNVIRSLHSKVNTFATGYCASSALRVLATGTGTRAAYCNTVLMFHGSEAPEANKPHSFDAISKEIELREWKAIAKIKDEMILDTTQHNFSAQEALDMGFIDTILCDEKMNKTAK